MFIQLFQLLLNFVYIGFFICFNVLKIHLLLNCWFQQRGYDFVKELYVLSHDCVSAHPS